MSTDGAIEFFERVFCYFRMAENSVGTIERFYDIAGHTVCLRFAGDALISQLTPAFEHLAVKTPVTPEFTICIADSQSSGLPLKIPHWKSDDYLPRGEVASYSDERFYTIYNFHTGAINLIDLEKNIAIFWTRGINYLPWWISGSPLQRIINCWMIKQGKQLTHAGAVGTAEGGVLLAGKSGSGKSTTSLACLEHGLSYVSEDYCLIETNPKPYVYSVYNSAKLEPHTLTMFPHLKDKTFNPNRKAHEKAFLFQQQIYPERMIKGFPIRAVLLPKITGNKKTELKPASIVEGLLALTPSTFFQLSNCWQESMNSFKALLKQTPCYHLELSSDLTEVSTTIHQFIERNESGVVQSRGAQ